MSKRAPHLFAFVHVCDLVHVMCQVTDFRSNLLYGSCCSSMPVTWCLSGTCLHINGIVASLELLLQAMANSTFDRQ